MDDGILSWRETVVTGVSGVEMMNRMFNPVGAKLDGWSEDVNSNISKYDDIFEELHIKHGKKSKWPPEIRLTFALFKSAFYFHMMNKMFKDAPSAERVMRENPDLMESFAGATANMMKKDANKSNDPFGGIMNGMGGLSNMLSGMFAAPTSSNTNLGPELKKPTNTKMRGPGNIDDLMNEIDQVENNRLEELSTMSESEIADDASIISGIFVNRNGRNTMNI